MKLVSTAKELPEVISALPLSCLGGNCTLDPKFFEMHIRRLPLSETLLLCCKLNLLFTWAQSTSVPGYQDKILKLLLYHHWLDSADYERMYKFIFRNRESFDDNPFFTRIHCLEMIRWTSVWGNSTESGVLNDINRKRSFARAMLMAFEFWSARTQQRILRSEQFEAGSDEQRQFESLRTFRECNLWQIPSSNYLWNFGRTHELYVNALFGADTDLQARVENELGMCIEDYTACIIGLSTLPFGWMDRTDVGIVDNFEFNPSSVCADTPHMTPIMAKFLSNEGQDPNQLFRAYQQTVQAPSDLTDLRPLREHPILVACAGQRATMIDLVFLAERASNGLLFKAAQLIGKDAFVRFGGAFEKYAIRRLDAYVRASQAKGIQVSGHERVDATVKPGGNEVEFTDYALVYDRTLILVEIKGKWLRDRAIASLIADDYWDEIYNKYVFDDSKGKTKRKGAAQLADSIDGWLNGRLAPKLNITVDDIDTIIPILFVSDPHLTVLYHGRFLAKEFQKLVPKAPEDLQTQIQLGRHNIVNLCVISIDEFEAFEARVQGKSLAKLLLDYSDHYRGRDISAGAYLAQLDPEPFAPMPTIAREAESALDRACLRLFGRSIR